MNKSVDYIELFQLKITEYYNDGLIQVNENTNAYAYSNYIRHFVESNFYNICTVSDLNGITYIINVSNISKISDSNDTIIIKFKDKRILNVKFINLQEKINQKKYIKFIYEANNFEKIYKNHNRIYVNSNFNNTNNHYSTIAAANNISADGDVIYITAGTYNEVITLKSGRIYYFEAGAIIYKNDVSGLLGCEANDNKKFIKVFGRGEFNLYAGAFSTTLSVGNPVIAVDEDYLYTIFVECKKLYHDNGRVIGISEAILKCKYIENDSDSYAVWDTDFGSNYLASPIVDSYLIESYKGEITFHQDSSNINYIFKNALIECYNVPGVFSNTGGAAVVTHTCENCRLNNKRSDTVTFLFSDDTEFSISEFNFYNTIATQSSGTYCTETFGTMNFNLYGYNYFNKNYNPSEVIINSINTADNYKLIA